MSWHTVGSYIHVTSNLVLTQERLFMPSRMLHVSGLVNQKLALEPKAQGASFMEPLKHEVLLKVKSLFPCVSKTTDQSVE
jgi:hypothetical protein